MSNTKITAEEANQMQKLEQLFHNRYLTPDFLHQLIAIYVKAIQSFNAEFMFMKSYFMEKMQFVLSAPQIMALLEGGGTAADQIRQTIRLTQRNVGSDIFQNQLQQNPPKKEDSADKPKAKQQQDRFQNYKPESHHHHTQEIHHHHHHDQKNQKNSALKLDLKMRLMKEVEENAKNIKKQINEVNKKIEKNEQKVKGITKNQEELLNERLANRKKKKLRKKSVEIKANVADIQGQTKQVEPPPINKQQLKEAHRQLTAAIFAYTIRLTMKQASKQAESRKNIKGRIKKAKENEQDDVINQQPEQSKPEEVKPQQISMKKKKQSSIQQKPQPRIKTIKRRLDSDDD